MFRSCVSYFAIFQRMFLGISIVQIIDQIIETIRKIKNKRTILERRK